MKPAFGKHLLKIVYGKKYVARNRDTTRLINGSGLRFKVGTVVKNMDSAAKCPGSNPG